MIPVVSKAAFLFMGKKKLPKSIKKFIRKEKSRFRGENLSMEEKKKRTDELYQRFFKKDQEIKEKEKVKTG